MSALAHKWGDVWSRWRGTAPAEGPDALPVRVHGTEFTRTRAAPARVKGFDQPLIWVTVTLLLWGLVMVYSASIAMPDNPRFGNYAQSHFLLRHIAAIGVALVVVTQILAIALAAILTGVVATAYTAQVQRRESLYEMEVREVLADGVVSEAEKQKLKTLQAKFGMSNEQVEAIARQVAAEKKSAS